VPPRLRRPHRAFRFGLLYVLFLVLFVLGSMPVGAAMPPGQSSEPGLLGPAAGLLVIALVSVGLVAALILTSRWSGWRLAVGLGLAWYGAVTFLTQIETWYFLTSLSVDPRMLPALFAMGIPTAFLFVPAAVWILGRGGRQEAAPPPEPQVGRNERVWIGKLAAIAVIYVVLYWTAGYFIAWQNPELRAFYGRPGDALPFLAHTADTLRNDPWLLPFQLLRGLLWALCALPVILGSRLSVWWTALLVGLLFSVPQNVAHLIANPLMPLASVRLSHMVETALSNFVFGVVVTWILYPERRRPGAAIGPVGGETGRGPCRASRALTDDRRPPI
jgi:hypothetical protein